MGPTGRQTEQSASDHLFEQLLQNLTSHFDPSQTSPEANDTNQTYCGLVPHQYLEAKFVLISVLGTLVGVLGVFGNMTTALILTRPTMRSPNNLFLTALAVFDTCLLVTAFLIYAMEYIIEYTHAFELYVAWLTYLRFVFALSHISQTGSVYTTAAVTLERFLAVVYPRYSKRICTKHGAAVSILCVTCFAVLFNGTKFFELEVRRNPECPGAFFQAYLLAAGSLMKNEIYGEVYTLWLSNIVMVFFPFICLLFFNSMIAYSIRKSMQRLRWAERISRHSELKEKSRDATRVLVVIVFIFLVCNFWGFVLALLERMLGYQKLAREYHEFYTFSREAINFLAIVNSSINFVIYCIFGKDFRRELIVVYGCGFKGIKLMLPVHDKFSTWRTSGGGSTNRPPPSDQVVEPRTKKKKKKSRNDSSPNLANVGMKQFSEAFGKIGQPGGMNTSAESSLLDAQSSPDELPNELNVRVNPGHYLDVPRPHWMLNGDLNGSELVLDDQQLYVQTQPVDHQPNRRTSQTSEDLSQIIYV